MNKNHARIIIITLLICGAASLANNTSLAQEQPQSISGEPVIFAPSGLSSKEQSELERRYRQMFRNKDMILQPGVKAPEEAIDTTGMEVSKKTAEEERGYRYFGVASSLRKAGRLEEAIEILDYILYKNPNDEYVKSYLNQVREELKSKEIKMDNAAIMDSDVIKNKKIKDLKEDGAAYYRQKRFDKAMVKFADILSLDPNDAAANEYMDRLKGYYLKEVRVEEIARGWQENQQGQVETKAKPLTYKEILQERKNIAKNLLTKKGPIEETAKKLLDTKDEAEQAAEQLLNAEEMKNILADKRAGNLLDQTELGFRVDKIVDNVKNEERKANLFTFGPGDVVQISVRDHPELSGTAQVRPKGDMVLPLTNEIITADGLTTDELVEKISEMMQRYVKSPAVSITILEYKSRMFYVIDESGCTPYPISRANFTLRDALFASDWGTARALGRVLVIKPSELHPIIKRIDAFDIIYRGRLANNIRIDNGDVIYIPLTAASKISSVVTDTFSPFGSISGGLDNLQAVKTSVQAIKKWKEFPYRIGK